MRDTQGFQRKSVPAPGAYAWFVCLVMGLCLAFSYMDRTVMSLLIVPMERDLGLSDTTLSLVQGTAFGVFYSTFGLLLARVADSWHRRNLIMIGVCIWCGATAACGLASGPISLFVARVSVAVGEAVLMPSAVSILADYFAPQFRGRALNIYSIGIYLGGGGSLALGGLVIHGIGNEGINLSGLGYFAAWRAVFFALGLSGLILLPLLAAVREPARLDVDGSAAGNRLTTREASRAIGKYGRAVFATVLGFGLISVGAQSAQSWMPTLFVRTHHWGIASAGTNLGIITLIAGPLGALLGGFYADALTRRGLLNAKLLVGITSAAGCALSALLLTQHGIATAFAGAMCLQLIVSFNFGTVQAALAEVLPNRVRGVGTSMYVASSNLLNALAGPIAVGAITDHVFHDPNAIATSIRIVSPAAFLLGLAVLWYGLRPYRLAILRQRSGGLPEAGLMNDGSVVAPAMHA